MLRQPNLDFQLQDVLLLEVVFDQSNLRQISIRISAEALAALDHAVETHGGTRAALVEALVDMLETGELSTTGTRKLFAIARGVEAARSRRQRPS